MARETDAPAAVDAANWEWTRTLLDGLASATEGGLTLVFTADEATAIGEEVATLLDQRDRYAEDALGFMAAADSFSEQLATAREEASTPIPSVAAEYVLGLTSALNAAMARAEAAERLYERLRQAAIEFRTDATDTFFVECFRCDTESTGRYIKCDYHNMRDAERRFDEAFAALDAARAGEEMRRGNWQRQKTHCLKGHPYDEVNTYRSPDGYRHCRTCNRKVTRGKRGWHWKFQTHCKHGHEYTPENTYYYELKGYRCRRCVLCHRLNQRKQQARRKLTS